MTSEAPKTLLEIAQFWAQGPKPPLSDQARLARAWLDLRVREARLEVALRRCVAVMDAAHELFDPDQDILAEWDEVREEGCAVLAPQEEA